MPKSKKRVKRDEVNRVLSVNPLKTKLGKVMIIILVLGFVLTTIVGAIYGILTVDIG